MFSTYLQILEINPSDRASSVLDYTGVLISIFFETGKGGRSVFLLARTYLTGQRFWRIM